MNKELAVKLSSTAYELNLFMTRSGEDQGISNFERTILCRVIQACEDGLELIYNNREELDEAQSRYQDNGGF
jgi:hypothetical protein